VTSKVYAGVDLGGTNIKAVLGTADGQILVTDNQPTLSHEGPEGVLDRLAGLVEELCRRADCRVAGLGMAAPGLIDFAGGRTLFFPNFPGKWRGVPVRDFLAPRLGCPVYLLNDVRTATLGELRYGHGRTTQTMALFAVGTGIGGGVVIDGRLRLGPLGAAGELGHQIILPDGPRCGCGNRGCLETLASAPAIAAEGVRLMLTGMAPKLHERVDGEPARVTPKTMAEAALAGEETVAEAIRRAAEYIGIAAVNVVVTLHPELIVLAGGVAQMGELLREPVEQTIRERVGMFPTDGVAVKLSQLGDQAGVLGGLALASGGGLLNP
jgi:glucokinase